jgi:hypothetical protein
MCGEDSAQIGINASLHAGPLIAPRQRKSTL